MKYDRNTLTQSIAIFVLLCGAFTALFGWTSQLLEPQIVLPTDNEATPQTTVTVVIDAGHGGEDGGTQSAEGLLEKAVNLEIAKLLDEMLHDAGITTVMTRTEDILLYDRNANYQGHKKMLDLAARRQMAESTEGAIFVSIHMNAFPEAKYRGLQVFYSKNDPDSQALASKIQQTAQEQLQPDNNRKIKQATSAIYLLDRLHCPAVLVECGFLSNPEEAALFATQEHRKQVASALFSAITAYISHEGA